ncbi:nuclear transport factor 2 family protein [Streptomyces sp. 4N509B]|uniref:nuclear transport factor 2 family protein n=1 Tax=Streptomyces sp. 4N509B TaxID=3457413 RepID=UPI003FD64C27
MSTSLTTPPTASTASTASAQDLVTAFFERFGSGDAEGVLALFADEVDFEIAGADTVPWTGRRTTRAGVAAFLREAGAVEPQEFVVERVLADGDTGVALGRFRHRVRSTGKEFASRFALHLTVEGGLIRRYHMFEDSHAIAEAFRA